jgi:TolA-binding protein
MNSDNASLSEEDLLKKAGGLSGQTRYEEAIQAYQSFLARFPSSLRIPDARMGIAYAKLKQDKTAESKILFQEIIQSYPASREAGEAALRLGYLKIREKDDAGAKVLFQNIATGTIKADSAVKAEAQARLDNFERREKIQTDPAFALLHQGYAKIAASDEEGAGRIFEQLISANPKSEAAGEASLRLAYTKLNKAGKAANAQEAENLRAEALARFEAIARGEIAASPSNRLEAMLRCAKTYHSRKERIRTLQAYREIAALSDADGIPDPDIHTELAGLYMELARSGKGSLDDCIRECDIVLSSEGATRKNKATALQMKAESVHFQNDFKTSIDLEKSLLETYPEQKPMAMLAHFYLGLSYYQLEDPWNSLKSMEKVEKDFSDSDNLPGNDLRLSARLYQAQALLKMEKRPEAKAILEQIIKLRPNSKEAHDARKLLDVLK